MNQRKSFIIHIDSLAVLDELDDAQAGQLFKTIKAFHCNTIVNYNKEICIAFVPFKNGKPSGNWEIFADNFSVMVNGNFALKYRPSGLAQGPDGALYVSDDVKGTIFKITYPGK